MFIHASFIHHFRSIQVEELFRGICFSIVFLEQNNPFTSCPIMRIVSAEITKETNSLFVCVFYAPVPSEWPKFLCLPPPPTRSIHPISPTNHLLWSSWSASCELSVAFQRCCRTSSKRAYSYHEVDTCGKHRSRASWDRIGTGSSKHILKIHVFVWFLQLTRSIERRRTVSFIQIGEDLTVCSISMPWMFVHRVNNSRKMSLKSSQSENMRFVNKMIFHSLAICNTHLYGWVETKGEERR